MFWLIQKVLNPYPRPRRVWIKVRFLHETPKAILIIHEGDKVWLPKSRIRKVKLRRSAFYLLIPEQLLLRADYTNYSKGQG